MKKGFLSKDDLMEGVRLEVNTCSLENVEEVYMEGTGEISVIVKEKR
jgi:uncharacterized membrane protein YcaP (DUF421 family)